MKLKYKQKILKLLIILLAVFGININNGFTAEMRQSLLSPLSNIDAGSLQKTFTYLVNQETYSEYKAIFEINAQDKPRRNLRARELADFLQIVKDICSILEKFSQNNAFYGIILARDKRTIDALLDDPPLVISFSKDAELRIELMNIFERISKQLHARENLMKSLAETMYKQPISQLKINLETAKRMLTPSMPIQSINFNPEILAYLEPGILKRIIENITWQNHDPDDYSGQRKIILNLEHPIVFKNRVINSLEIKGVVYRVNDRISLPLTEKYNTIKVVRLNNYNSTILEKRILLKGGMSLAAAKREYLILEKLQNLGNSQYDYPIGFGIYKNYTYKGKQFGFVITGVENSKRTRMADWFFDNYDKIFSLIATDKAKFARLAAGLFDSHESFLRQYGLELRRFHDQGFYHGYPHMLNISWDKAYENIVLNDFEASKLITHLPIEKRVGYRLIDISSAYAHFIAFITKDNNLLELAAFSEGMNYCNNPFAYFLQGYFGEDMPGFNFHGFISESIYPVVSQGMALINEMDQEVVTKLFQLEGFDIGGSVCLNPLMVDEQDLMNELACSQAI